MTKEDIMSAKEICSILQIKPNTLYSKRWRKEANPPTFKQGKYLFAFKKEFWSWYNLRIKVA